MYILLVTVQSLFQIRDSPTLQWILWFSFHRPSDGWRRLSRNVHWRWISLGLSHWRESRETSYSVLLRYSGCGSVYRISMVVNFWVHVDDRTSLIWIRNSQCSYLDDCNIDVMSEFFSCLEEPALYIVGIPKHNHGSHVLYLRIICCAADVTWLSRRHDMVKTLAVSQRRSTKRKVERWSRVLKRHCHIA